MKSNYQQKIILAGGSGFLGRALAEVLTRRGDEVIVLTRRPEAYRGAGRAIYWDGEHSGPWSAEMDGARAIVNLTGKNVNCRPSKKNRREILTSRVNSVRALGDAIRECLHPPEAWIQASSLAIYGDARDRICDEAARVAEGFPANVCTAWEEALGEALLPQVRPAVLRIGFVLGKDDGALPFLARLTRYGLGGAIGSGKQWISWIHEADMVRLLLRAVDDDSIRGIYNVTGPEPVTNAEFMRSLRAELGRPWSPPAPAIAVKPGAWLLNSDPQIALTGRRCVPARLSEAGFDFRFPELRTALGNLFESKNQETNEL